MPEFEYQVTAVTFGLGLQLGSSRTARINDHLREVASEGWRLVAINHSGFEIPIAWRFFWERPRLVERDPDEPRSAPRPPEEGIMQR